MLHADLNQIWASAGGNLIKSHPLKLWTNLNQNQRHSLNSRLKDITQAQPMKTTHITSPSYQSTAPDTLFRNSLYFKPFFPNCAKFIWVTYQIVARNRTYTPFARLLNAYSRTCFPSTWTASLKFFCHSKHSREANEWISFRWDKIICVQLPPTTTKQTNERAQDQSKLVVFERREAHKQNKKQCTK